MRSFETPLNPGLSAGVRTDSTWQCCSMLYDHSKTMCCHFGDGNGAVVLAQCRQRQSGLPGSGTPAATPTRPLGHLRAEHPSDFCSRHARDDLRTGLLLLPAPGQPDTHGTCGAQPQRSRDSTAIFTTAPRQHRIHFVATTAIPPPLYSKLPSFTSCDEPPGRTSDKRTTRARPHLRNRPRALL